MSHTELASKLYEVISSAAVNDRVKATSALNELTAKSDDLLDGLLFSSSQAAVTNLLAELTHQVRKSV